MGQRGDNRRKVVEEEAEKTEEPKPQTGIKHIPNLFPLSQDVDAYRSPLLIFTFQRAEYLSKTLDDILKNIGNHCSFGCPIVISEDGSHSGVRHVIEKYSELFRKRSIPVIHLQHDQYTPPKMKLRRRPAALAYQALAQHYGWAITQVFNGLDSALPLPDRVIILEEDIHTAPDFFSYMKATSHILDQDSTLFAVSAFNDNGHLVKDSHRVLRTDFFPGLGWMMTRKLWKDELEAKWPRSYWDDWLREPSQRRNRQVLRPEVSRTFHFGQKGGASNNQFGSILNRVKLNKENVDWSKEDLSYLAETAFSQQYGKLLANSVVVKTLAEAKELVQSKNTRLEYANLLQFQDYAAQLDIMQDEKASILRTAYKGVVETRPYEEYILFLTPPIDILKRSFPSMGH